MVLKKLDTKFDKFCNKNKINQKALSLGFVFFIVFWIVFDSIIFGISLGFVMYIAFLEEEKENKKSKKSKIEKSKSKNK